MNMQGMNMAMSGMMGIGINSGGGAFGGMSDTGAAPDNSGGQIMNMHPMQMFQAGNFTGSSLAQYHQMNNIMNQQQFSSQDKKRSNKMNVSKNNVAAIRFNMQDQFNHQENWDEEHASASGHNQGMLPHHGHGGQHLYKVGGSKMKLGAATSTNFMK